MSTLARPRDLLSFGVVARFILIASVVLVSLAFLVDSEIFPVIQKARPTPLGLMQFTFPTAFFLSLILPLFLSVGLLHYPALRRLVGFFVLTLVAQVLTEIALSRLAFPSLVIPTAILYVGFRLAQCINGLRILSRLSFPRPWPKRLTVTFFVVNLGFWAFVFALLVGSRLPAILI